MEIRTKRRFGVTAQLDNSERARLMHIRAGEGWDTLLDVLEQTIIEMESEFTSHTVANPEAIVAYHRKVQAAWQMFEHFQNKVDTEVAIFLRETEKPMAEEPTEDDAIRQITEPFNEHPELESQDFMGGYNQRFAIGYETTQD